MKVIIIHGPPASGKTTVAKRLSAELGFIHFSKDDFKECLFDHLGVESPAESKKLGGASQELLYVALQKAIDSKTSVILESNFTSLGKQELTALFEGRDIDVIEVFLTASSEVLIKRFKDRWESGNRHPGHQDDQRIDDLHDYLESNDFQKMNLSDKCIEIDTSEIDKNAFNSIVSELS